MATQKGGDLSAQRILRIADVAEEPLEFLTPIGGYAKMPLVSLEEAIKPLVEILPDVQSHAYVAKQKCQNPADGLTPDESASIMLYTMSWDPMDECLYIALNRTLRSTNRQQALKPWYSYLRLFLNALARLPPLRQTVHRGVKLDMSKRYTKGATVVWWGFSSCTTEVEVLQCDLFLGEKDARTIFIIETETARDICKHSFFPMENEVLLMAATQFQVTSSLKQAELRIIQLKETHPPHPLLQPVEIIPQIASSSASIKTRPSKTKYQNSQLETFIIENQNIKELDLSQKKLIDNDMSIVAHYLLQATKTLITLNLARNQIGDEGIQHLCTALRKNTTLTTLHLYGNHIGNRGVEYLVDALRNNTTLRDLNLRHNQIGDPGREQLTTLMKTNVKLKISL